MRMVVLKHAGSNSPGGAAAALQRDVLVVAVGGAKREAGGCSTRQAGEHRHTGLSYYARERGAVLRCLGSRASTVDACARLQQQHPACAAACNAQHSACAAAPSMHSMRSSLHTCVAAHRRDGAAGPHQVVGRPQGGGRAHNLQHGVRTAPAGRRPAGSACMEGLAGAHALKDMGHTWPCTRHRVHAMEHTATRHQARLQAMQSHPPTHLMASSGSHCSRFSGFAPKRAASASRSGTESMAKTLAAPSSCAPAGRVHALHERQTA